MTISILIADDHTLLRKGLRSLLSSETDMEVIAEAANGEEAIDLVHRLAPTVLLADINMPAPNGIEVATRIFNEKLKTKVLILTMYEDVSMMREALNAGARGYVIKRAAESELVEAIHTVCCSDDLYIHPLMRQGFQDGRQPDNVQPLKGDEPQLNSDESTLVRMLAEGKSYHQMAEHFGISEYTAKLRCAALMDKLDLKMRTEFIIYARNHGLTG